MHVPFRRTKEGTVPSRRGKKKIYIVPSRREKFCSPSRPVTRKKVIALYRSVPVRNFTPIVPSCPIQPTTIFIILPSRPFPSLFFPPPYVSKQSRPVPFRTLPVMKVVKKMSDGSCDT